MKRILFVAFFCIPTLTLANNSQELKPSDFIISDPSACSYTTIENKPKLEIYQYTCEINLYGSPNLYSTLLPKQNIFLNYAITGTWTTAYSEGQSGWHWRITNVSTPVGKLTNYSNPYVTVYTLPIHITVNQVSDQHYHVTEMGGVSFPNGGNNTFNLPTQSILDLYSGAIIDQVFNGTIKWNVSP